jgi:hypothetical protein
MMLDNLATKISCERYIINRGKLLSPWRAQQESMKKLAGEFIYIRVGGERYRPISIHFDNPCGSLLRRSGNGGQIGGNKSLEIALENASAAAPADKKKPGNRKPEHVVQAGLIQYALLNDMRMQGRLNGFSDYFDELIFITDELKAGDIRADIIALGGKNGKYFPVFIELKGIRSFNRVLEQLIAAQQEMSKIRDSFVEMLVNGTGKAIESISFDEYKLLVVWPGAPSGKGNASAAKAISEPRLESARGHLLLGEFPTMPRGVWDASKAFNSVVKFVESA